MTRKKDSENSRTAKESLYVTKVTKQKLAQNVLRMTTDDYLNFNNNSHDSRMQNIYQTKVSQRIFSMTI